MKIKQAAALAARIAGRTAVPYFGYVLLQPSEGGITLTARNYGDMIEIDVEDVLINGPVLLPAAAFAKLIAFQPEAVLSVKGHVLSIETEHSLITYGGAPVDKLDVAPPFQDPAETDEIPFNLDDFAWCTSNASPDDSRPVLSGVAISKHGALAASDGFRLRVAGDWETEGFEAAPAHSTPPMLETSRVLQAKALPYMPAVEKIRANKTYALFEALDVRYWSQLIQGMFPNFIKLIPPVSDLKWRIDIDTLYLRPAVKGPLSLIGRDGSGIMRITQPKGQPDKIQFTTRAEEVGEATFKLPADIIGEPRIALNVGYFREVLAGCPSADTLTIQGIDTSSQMLFTTDDEHRREVIMPMFVQW